MSDIDYRDPRPIYEQIRDKYLRLILSGAIEKDEKMPSVRELATSMAINPNTIQRAYRELENMGFIYTIPGRGSFASKPEKDDDKQQKKLLADFDRLCEKLMLFGITRQELCDRLPGKKEV